MGIIDEKVLEYFSDPERFADIMNFEFFNGKNIIKGSELEEMDSVMIKSAKGKHEKSNRKIADKKMLWRNRCLRVLIQEYQSYVDYQMVIRCMLTEAQEYYRQHRIKKNMHRLKRDLKRENEFLSKMKKDEKFMPVITLVVNLSDQSWDGEKTLYGMLEGGVDEMIRKYVSDYHLNVLDYTDYESFDGLVTDARKIFEVMRFKSDKKRIKELLEKDDSYRDLDDETADLIEVLSNIKINPTEGGKRDMCKAWIEQKEEGRAEGLAEGRAEGRAEGIDMINTLYNRLILAGRIDDMKRAATDKEYQKKLMEEIIPDMLERLK